MMVRVPGIKKKVLQEGIKGFRDTFFFKGFQLFYINRKLTTNLRKKLYISHVIVQCCKCSAVPSTYCTGLKSKQELKMKA